MSRVAPLVIGSMVVIAVGLTACPNYLFEQKFPSKVKEMQIVVPAATPIPADVLFVVDNSCSMDNKQTNLRTNFSAFINEVAGTGDYQIAVVTTDQVNGVERGGVSMSQFEQTSAPFPLLNLDVSMCNSAMIPKGCFRGPDMAKRIIQAANLSRDDQIKAFQDNAQVGSCGSGIETGLKAVESALQQTAPGGCNEGFLRKDANLVVVILSDENDTDDTPLQHYVDVMGQFKDYSKIRVAMIVASESGDAKNCNPALGPQCGKMGCDATIPKGSMMPCSMASPCPGPSSSEPQGESCVQPPTGGGTICVNKVFAVTGGFSDKYCGWCTYYNEADCCYALQINSPYLGEPGRYVAFARAMEQKIAPAAMLGMHNCTAPEGTPTACLVDTICQDNFSHTLARIAKELVLTNKYTLNPSTNYPAGVAVHISGGRFGADGKDLVNCASPTLMMGQPCDFTVNGSGDTLVISGPNTPATGETVQIYFIVPN